MKETQAAFQMGKHYLSVEQVNGAWQANLYGVRHEALKQESFSYAKNALEAQQLAVKAFGMDTTDCKQMDFATLADLVQHQEKLKAIPLDLRTYSEAEQAKDLNAYYASHAMNRECMRDLSTFIDDAYRNNRLSGNVGKQLVGIYGAERVTAVLSNLVQNYDWDGRYSSQNKQWAKRFTVPQDPTWKRYNSTNAHPGLVNLVVNQVRKELTAEQSLTDKLAQAKQTAQEQNATQPTTPRHKQEQSL